jgi:exonuclease SbcC
MKIAHISDTHIHNTKEHSLYRTIFSELYKVLKSKKVDCIVHTGDIYHNKINLSPEAFNLAGEFFNHLANIAPTFCILGNHDCLVSNMSRLDSISPLENLINNKNFKFLKDSGIYNHENFDFIVHSVLDKEYPEFILDENKINIALYHGIVSGVNTIEEYQLNKLSHKYFQKFDYTFLGDIHESNLVLDLNGKIRYPGSTIQQNFGESENKGFLLWDIKSKKEFDCEFVKLTNKKPFVTIRVNKELNLDNYNDYAKDCKVRIINDSNLDSVKFRKLANVIKNKYKFKNVVILEQSKTENIRKINDSFTVDDLHDVNTHEKLLKQYFKDEKEEAVKKIIELNSIYFNKLDSNNTNKVKRWEIQKLSWDNLFNYGEDNSINFQSLQNGVVGIFGKNRSGKSSVIDSLLFSIFNKISKNLKSNQELINSSKQNAKAEIEISVGENKYKIVRKLSRTKNNKSSTNLELYYNNILNNDSSRTETDKIIQNQFGTLDSFLLTSVSSQFGFNNFIDEGSTKRKEILANFLELEIFDKLYDLAKEDYVFLKNTIKKLETKNFSEAIKEITENISLYTLKENEIISEIKISEEREREVEEQIILLSNLNKNLSNVVLGRDVELETQILDLETINKNLKEEIEINKKKFIELKKRAAVEKAVLENINIDDLKHQLQFVRNINYNLERAERELEKISYKIQQHQKNVSQLEDVPCKGSFNCKFLESAMSSKNELRERQTERDVINKNIFELKTELAQYDLASIKTGISSHEDASKNASSIENELTRTFHSIEKSALLIKNNLSKLTAANSELVEYKKFEANLEEIKKLSELQHKKEEIKNELESKKNELKKVIETLYKNKNNLERIEEEKQNYNKTVEEFYIYEKYMKSIGANGIRYSIIKDKLQIINTKLKNYLDNIADFEVSFEDQDNNLNIVVKDSQGTRAINMCSGSEKSLASMAIRLSLLSVSNLSRSNIFILDEPATALDAENLEGFTKILEMIKNDFKTIFLISHIDALKDLCDEIINIENDSGCAKIIF